MASTVLILASSRKPGGRCVAGKIVGTNQWIRPVGNAAGSALTTDEAVYTNSFGGQRVKPLIKVDMELGMHVPLVHQPENYLYLPGWVQTHGYGVKPHRLHPYLDSPDTLWGSNRDRVSDHDIRHGIIAVPQSLYLIAVSDIVFSRNAHESARITFTYNGLSYTLACTDLNYEKFENGTLVPNGILCISLGEDFNGDHYKIVATIFGVQAE